MVYGLSTGTQVGNWYMAANCRDSFRLTIFQSCLEAFHLHDENIFARHFESNIWACCMLLKIQWQHGMGEGRTCEPIYVSE